MPTCVVTPTTTANLAYAQVATLICRKPIPNMKKHVHSKKSSNDASTIPKFYRLVELQEIKKL